MRIAIFTDANCVTTAALIRATTRLIDARDDLELCGFVTTRPDAFRSTARADARRRARRVVVAAFDPRHARRLGRRSRIDIHGVARRHSVPVLSPPAAGLNDPGFVAHLRSTLRPDAALSYYGTTIWKEPLLAALPQAVNYHDGLLPDYRGVGATSFSIYHGEERSGFTFHRMVAAIDAGPVLARGSVPVGTRAFPEVDHAKAAAAVAALPTVLDQIVSGHPGSPQLGVDRYFSARDMRALVNVDDPTTVTIDEIARRIRAFEIVRLRIGDRRLPVTRIRSGRRGRLGFRDANGGCYHVDRVLGLPPRLGRALPVG